MYRNMDSVKRGQVKVLRSVPKNGGKTESIEVTHKAKKSAVSAAEGIERRHERRRNRAAVRSNLNKLDRRNLEAAMAVSDLLDLTSDGEIKQSRRFPEQFGCEGGIIYVHACYEDEAIYGLGRWQCPRGCSHFDVNLDLYELDYAV